MARLYPCLIRLRVDKIRQLDVLGRLDFVGGTVTHEDRLTLPYDGNSLTFHHRRQINLHRG